MSLFLIPKETTRKKKKKGGEREKERNTENKSQKKKKKINKRTVSIPPQSICAVFQLQSKCIDLECFE